MCKERVGEKIQYRERKLLTKAERENSRKGKQQKGKQQNGKEKGDTKHLKT